MNFQGKLSFKNKNILIKFENCSCYYCLKTFKTAEIDEFTDDESTALCPYCGVDSVVCFEDGSLPSIEVLKEWHQFSFSSTGVSFNEIKKNKERVKRLTLLDNAKIYTLKNSKRLFFFIKNILINTADTGEIQGCILFDIENQKQLVYEKKLFSDLFLEISLKEKQDFYSNLSARWNYRLVYSTNELRLAVHECYYPKISYTSIPTEVSVSINETNPEKIKDDLLMLIERMQNAFAQPVVFNE